MSQVPLAPPTPTGGPNDGWLFLLWQRVTAAGQILWSSITPSTSADVAAVVTDETGSPGSLVFSGNPTLQGITDSGNLVFTGTGTRIIGDFSNATFSNRAMWQTSTANSSTTLGIIPNGTGPNGTLNIYNNSDPTNAGRLALTCGTGEAAIFSTIHGSGTYVPLGVYVNNVETARFALNGVNTFGGVSTAPALKVTPVASQARWIEVTGATSSGNPKLNTSAGSLELGSTGSTAVTIDSSGRSLFGYGTSVQVAGISPTLQINAASAVANFSIVRNTTPGGSGAFLYLSATRGPAGTNTAVQAGDGLGSIFASGADGTNIVNGAAITFRAEGTISTGIVPATIVFYTYNSSGVLTEAAQFNSSQICTFSGLSTAPALKVTPVASQARWVEVTGATSSGDPTIGVSGGILAISSSVAITGVVSTSGYTVATLPAGTVGQRAYVTDALAPAYGVAVAGGGAVTVPVFYNGAAWICA